MGGSALAEAWLRKGVGSELHCLSGPCHQTWGRSDLCLAKGPWELGADAGALLSRPQGEGLLLMLSLSASLRELGRRAEGWGDEQRTGETGGGWAVLCWRLRCRNLP